MSKNQAELNEIYLHIELEKMGKISNKTLLEKAGFDVDVEMKQIQEEKKVLKMI